LRTINAGGGYANLVLSELLRDTALAARDTAFVTDLVNTTCRLQGTLDAVIAAAAGRPVNKLESAVRDVLRLGAAQLWLGVPAHAAVSETVTLARSAVGARVSGLVNAIMRRIYERTTAQWLDLLTAGLDELSALALRYAHPKWIVEVFAGLVPASELPALLEADNTPATPVLAIRPGLIGRATLLDSAGGQPTPYSPFGIIRPGNPATLPELRAGLVGVQDEGSQLVTLAAIRALRAVTATDTDELTPLVSSALPAPPVIAPWLDMCAGPGGKAALLAGLALEWNTRLLASEVQPHRAQLVAQALRAYTSHNHLVITADARNAPWQADTFALTLVDAPCSGLGALRRRPDARWRRTPESVDELRALQRALLDSAIRATAPGGVIAWITCSPHPLETAAIVYEAVADAPLTILDAPALLPEVPDAAAATDPRFVQLWPHRHGTDAMFLALARKGY
jgi:16S rRNA (cytosine967-C5)-methyltransferase